MFFECSQYKPDGQVLKLHATSLEEAKACSPMCQHGVIGLHNCQSREAATETEHQMLLSSLRDFREYLIAFRGFTPTAICCHRFAVKSVQRQKAQAIGSKVAKKPLACASGLYRARIENVRNNFGELR